MIWTRSLCFLVDNSIEDLLLFEHSPHNVQTGPIDSPSALLLLFVLHSAILEPENSSIAQDYHKYFFLVDL